MTSPGIRMLFFTREEFPTHRVDVEVLFGRELIGRGNSIDFVMQAASEQVAVGPQAWRGRTVYVGPTRTGSGLWSRLLKQFRSLWHDLRSLSLVVPERYDAVQVRDKFFIAAIALVVAHLRGLKFFFWLSFPFPEDDVMRSRAGNSRSRLLVHARGIISGALLYRWILPRCDHAFVQSDRMKLEVCGHGIEAEKMTAVPMGVDSVDTVAMPERSTAAGTMLPQLGYLGTLDSNRKLGILIEMVAELKREGVEVRLLLIGDSSEPGDRQMLEDLASRLDVARQMEITGLLPRQQAMERIRDVDICLSPIAPSPIFRVGSPTKLVEYLAVGLPVVANDHPEQEAILHSSRAGVCVPWGARHFARGVRFLLRKSRPERATMGERGRAWVRENRTYSRIADDVEKKYEELLSS